MEIRRVLYSSVNSTATGSIGFGEFNAGIFSRLVGMVSVTGSVTFRYRMSVQSGTYAVNSSFVANSGPSIFDVLNYGRTVDLGFTAANSQLFSAIIFGQVER